MSDPEDLFRSIQERLRRVRSMISSSGEGPDEGQPPGGERERHETEPAASSGERGATPPWPAWAVVDWTRAVDEASPPALRGLSDVVVPVMSGEEKADVVRIEDPQPIDVGSTGPPDPTSGSIEAIRPEVVHRPSADESGLAVPPTRLAELLREASFAAQEARERAARWQGEARVLREELEHERAELERERTERERLMVELARRRHWWSPPS
jgi:hypothetical protein